MSDDFQFSRVPRGELLHDVSRQPRIEDWDEYFLAIAFLVARKSKDPSTKTGCVVQRNRRILATGYNGFPQGCPDDEALYVDRTYKYKNIAHCEANAVFAAAFQGVALQEATMYSTSPPCTACSQAIINAGIIRAVWPAANKFDCDSETGKRWEGDATGNPQALANLKHAGVHYDTFKS
jgi:dCMP deaminase